MTIHIGINGFGRIGRLVLRGIKETGRPEYQVAAINDLGAPETNAHLLRHDTVHGRFSGEVKVVDGAIDIGTGPIKVLSEKEPSKLPWRDLGVEGEARKGYSFHGTAFKTSLFSSVPVSP